MNPIVQEDLEAIRRSPLDWQRFRNKAVLITGANGFLPAYMVETLLYLNDTQGLDCRVVGIVRNLERAKARFSAHLGKPTFILAVADISEGVPVVERCDFIIHAASQASPKYFKTDPVGTMNANVIGTHHLLRQACEWRCEKILYFSSGEVYGEVPSNVLIGEKDFGYIDILNPRSCYAESKRAAETMMISYATQFQLDCSIVRPFHTYGPGMALDDGRVFSDFVSNIVHRENLIIHSDGSAVRAFCYLSDAVAGFFTVLLAGENCNAYNVGNPSEAISIRDLARLLVDLFPEFKLEVEYKNRTETSYSDSPVSVIAPNIDHLQGLGWAPRYRLREGFKRTVQYYQ